MSTPAFNAILDELLLTRKITGDPGMIQEMSAEQRFCVNECKKAFKRLAK